MMGDGIGMDIIGSVAIVKFPLGSAKKDKIKVAHEILKEHKSIKTVLEKVGKFKGRLRKQETKYVLGENTKEVLYRENGCVFRLNVDKTYFSPRLSNERKEISSHVKKGDDVLVMFAGVAPYSVVIAKKSKANKVVSVEINKEASKYAKKNVELNKLQKRIEIVQGDVKRIARNFVAQKRKFDVIVMPRPQLKESFLHEAFILSKSGTRIFYYDFCGIDEMKNIIEKVENEARDEGRDIKILRAKIAGEVAPYRVRLRVDFIVL